MSPDDMNLNSEPCEGTEPPDWSAAKPTGRPGYIMRTDGKDCEYRLGVNAKGTVIVNGVDLGPVAELADLVELAGIGAMRVEQEKLRMKPDRWMEMNQKIREAVEAFHNSRPKEGAP